MKKMALACGLLLISAAAHADRSVSIATPDGKVQLINGSSVPVTYDIECYDKVTGANLLTSGNTGQTLAPKASKDWSLGVSCASNAAPTKTLTQGPYYCAGSTTFAGANALCGSNGSICTIQKLSTYTMSGSDWLYGYWMSAGTGVTTFSQSWGKGYSTYTTTGGGKNYQPTVAKGSGGICSTGASGPTTGTYEVGYCQVGDVNGSWSGTLCCPNNNGTNSCKVTIKTPATPTAGSLQSPQFKGGAAF